MTFGNLIAEERKKAKLSQKELAALVKREDGTPISPQYLNDIERDRRNALSDFLIEQFAKALKIDAARLYYWAKKIPDDVRVLSPPPFLFCNLQFSPSRVIRSNFIKFAGIRSHAYLAGFNPDASITVSRKTDRQKKDHQDQAAL
jgi:transcriptional regulator with XRE-family HTH domain